MFGRSKRTRPDDSPTKVERPPAGPIESESLGLRIVPAPIDTPEQPQQPVSSRSSDRPHAPHPPLIDVIFVHGLGGSSRGTWTHPKSGFWPTWLQEGNCLENVRISTFGYDANWDPTKRGNALGTADFARKLLTALDLHYTKFENTPTVFVAHSLGGLVVKKAIIEAHNHFMYAEVLRNVKGVIFLGTPHRGADLAKLLKTFLAATFSPRTYVDQLKPGSETIQEINRTFLDRSRSLELTSFYESTGMRSFGVIVPESSATLGLPNERSAELHGDHTEITKFTSKEDDNFRTVSGILVKMVFKIRQDSMVEVGKT